MSAGGFATVNLQLGDDIESPDLPTAEVVASWVNAAVAAAQPEAPVGCITVRIVSIDESAALNTAYRDKAGPTNVLAFPAGPSLVPDVDEESETGDLVVCLEVTQQEAAEQGKTLHQHLAHLIVHGSLHLLGHDHQDAIEAAQMEAMERCILGDMGIPDPYQTTSEDLGKNGNN